jgi:hypothetical protein
LTEEAFRQQEALRKETELKKQDQKEGLPDRHVNLDRLQEMISTLAKQSEAVQSIPVFDSRLIIGTIKEIATQYSLALQDTVDKIRHVEESKKIEEFNQIIGELTDIGASIPSLGAISSLLVKIEDKLSRLEVNADLEKTVLQKLNRELDSW